jgi:hypothetical protein
MKKLYPERANKDWLLSFNIRGIKDEARRMTAEEDAATQTRLHA